MFGAGPQQGNLAGIAATADNARRLAAEILGDENFSTEENTNNNTKTYWNASTGRGVVVDNESGRMRNLVSDNFTRAVGAEIQDGYKAFRTYQDKALNSIKQMAGTSRTKLEKFKTARVQQVYGIDGLRSMRLDPSEEMRLF